jgi:Fe2+ or Zn2+ uptake regulation protein
MRTLIVGGEAIPRADTVAATNLNQAVARRLGERDARYTTGRQMVVQALAASDGPRSAAELHEEIGAAVPLSSLYRSLSVLEGAGVVEPHFGVRGITRYELAEWISGHHHHLVCTECGSVEDIDVARGLEAKVRALVDEIAAGVSFLAVDHTLEIEGRCGRCR